MPDLAGRSETVVSQLNLNLISSRSIAEADSEPSVSSQEADYPEAVPAQVETITPEPVVQDPVNTPGLVNRSSTPPVRLDSAESALPRVDIATVRSFVEQTADQSLIPQNPIDTVAERYKKAWHQRVEGISQLNYPRDVMRLHLSGQLKLRVVINTDGSLGSISIEQSSGHEALDDTALTLVEEAAPFEPLPPNLPRTNDQFVFTSTWEFRR